ncbi:Sialin [Pseudolycoriella hygida]|uniref:Sialin n=1 Tax=Pseudolycoriella hygida TaxID=35572 RepID=A0A9Q0S7C9_9DIPT|nr:Sialin [Pseudolycoriella hygida]
MREGEIPQSPIECRELLDDSPANGKCPKSSKVSTKCRNILWHLSFWGFIINYVARSNLNMAIVSMARPRNQSNSSASSECFNHSSSLPIVNAGNFTSDNFNKHFSVERTIMDALKLPYNDTGFDWTEYEYGQCLGSFYWFFWSTHLMGGYLANRFGTKLIFGISNFLSCAISCLIPMAAYLNFNLLLAVRVTQGILNGFCWPAMYDIVSRWIPPNERSTFVTAYIGGSVGLAIFYPIFGYILTVSSWEWIFHFSAMASLIWFIFWQCCVYNSPAEHPRIDSSELNYITKALGDSVQNHQNVSIPWISILTSFPLWITIIGFWGSVWQILTLMIQLPSYFKLIHNFDYSVSGLLSGGPYILRMGFSYIFSSLIDYLLRSKTLTRTNARKFAVFVNSILSGFVVMLLAYSGCNSTAAIVLSSVAITLLGAQASGFLCCFVDLAPNFSSILMGMALTISVLSGTVSSHIVGVLTNNNQTSEQWKLVFFISAGMTSACGMIFIIFGSAELQKWNNSSNEIEMKSLKGKREK